MAKLTKKVAAKPAPASAAPAETQSFEAVFAIGASGNACAAGDTIELTRSEFDELKALGAVKGAWADGAK